VLKIAVFVSGRGSNLQAILNSPKLTDVVVVKAVVSDKADCPAFEIARKSSIPLFSVGKKEGSLSYLELTELLLSLEIELIVLAGFLKLIPENLLKAYQNRMINIHPALLPSFGGTGMYGMKVHKAVFESSAQVSGASVHFVDETFDTGKIIAQRCVDITNVNSPEEIAERVLKIEHQLLPDVIELIAKGKIRFSNGRVSILK
jgi:formyltetrahydrofolate-dependent phosphoribosylglycinamide formyltransferase